MGLSLEELLVFNQGDIASSEFRTGRTMQIWLKEETFNDTRLFYAQEGKPGHYELIVTESIEEGANLLPIMSRFGMTLYRNEVLKFESGKIVIVKSTTELRGYPYSDDLPIYQSDNPIDLGEQTNIYSLQVLHSTKEGGFPNISVTYAEAHNKNQGFYPVFQKVREDAIVTITGDMNFNDPTLPLLKKIQLGYVSKLFVQFREGVDNGSYGEGYLACEYWGIPHIALSDTESKFINFTLELKVIGKVDPYKIITGPFRLRYCPFDARYTDIYRIDYTFIIKQDYVNYCSQDTTGFYDFATAP